MTSWWKYSQSHLMVTPHLRKMSLLLWTIRNPISGISWLSWLRWMNKHIKWKPRWTVDDLDDSRCGGSSSDFTDTDTLILHILYSIFPQQWMSWITTEPAASLLTAEGLVAPLDCNTLLSTVLSVGSEDGAVTGLFWSAATDLRQTQTEIGLPLYHIMAHLQD